MVELAATAVAARGRSEPALAHVAHAAERLPKPETQEFGRVFDRFADARVVVLAAGVAGAAEIEAARAAITMRLVSHGGFNLVAVDADEEEVRRLNAAMRVRTPPAASGPLAALARDIAAWNRTRPDADKVELVSLDRYNLCAAGLEAHRILAKLDPTAAAISRARFGVLGARATGEGNQDKLDAGRLARWEGKVVSRLADRLRRVAAELPQERDARVARDDARLLKDAEAVYRAQYYGGREAWNSRARLLAEALFELTARNSARAVVWTDAGQGGDARGDIPGMIRGRTSLGRLVREQFKDRACLLGFGAYEGRVLSALHPGEPPAAARLSASPPGTLEALMHHTGLDRFLLDLRPGENSSLRRALADERSERFVVGLRHPDGEACTHLAACRLPEQFDGYVWIDKVTPADGLVRSPARPGSS